MTSTTSNPVRRFNVRRVFSVLFHPKAAFAEIASEARATWSTPMLLLTITAIIAVVTVGYLNTRAAMMGGIALPADWEYWSPDMQDNYMQAQQTTQGALVVYVLPMLASLASLWLGWFILAGLLHLGSTLFGGRGSMQGALNLVGWGSLPFALRDLLRAAYMLLARHTITSPSLSGFATSIFGAQLLSHVDLFWVWSVILLAVGFAIVDGLPRSKALANALIVTILVLLV